MSTRSRSAPPLEDDLRLPRPPGVIRRFWARHPVIADVLIALVCLLTSLTPASTFRLPEGVPGPHPASILIVVLTVVTCASLMRRRQWPVAVFVLAYVLAAVFLFAPAPVGPSVVLVASYSLAVYRSSRAAWLGFGIGLGALSLLAGILVVSGVVGFAIGANAVVGELFLALIGTLIGVNVGNRKRYLEAIIDRSRQLLRERDQQAQLAASAERARIAREMHDIVSHSLTVIVALTEGASATSDVDRARAATTQAAQTARGALREMRDMLGVLRDDTDAAPLLPTDDDAVGAAVDSARRAGFPVTLRTTTTGASPADLPRAVRFAAGRVVQEGLTNAMRHAPAATAIDVVLAIAETEVTIEIRNDGAGDPATPGGYGLRGLRERVDLVGGTLVSGPVAPGRWRLHAVLPLVTGPDDPRQNRSEPEAS